MSLAEPAVIAHRGGALIGVENSELTIRAALELGADGIETDVRATADGVAVLIHDPDLVEMAGDNRKIAQLQWSEAKKIELKDGSHLLRLDEALEKFPETSFSIDAKCDAVTQPMLHAVAQANAFSRVSFATFSAARMKEIRRFRSDEIRTSLTPPEVARLVLASLSFSNYDSPAEKLSPTRLRELVFGSPLREAVAAQVPLKYRSTLPVLTPRFIGLAHAAQLDVQVWTVNHPDRISALLHPAHANKFQRVDGIITDSPDIALLLR